MNSFTAYRIKDSERFNPYNYPIVRDELQEIFKATGSFSARDKQYIIISFLKNHSLKNEWIRAHPELTSLFTEQQFATSHIEALFDSCKDNLPFMHSFEDYIRNNID